MIIIKENAVRLPLGMILSLLALNALAGGYYGMAGAENVPLEWLEGSPFKSYFLPSLFLFVVIGGSCILAAILVFNHHRYARNAAFICGILVLLWIITQVSIIGYVSWMQPTTTMVGMIILFLTYLLPKTRN
ncbi:hypothetical protein Q0590_12155 [Rhodocytophaga aerolata]|uniref:DUF4293 domain-containing protein n=1 Tax=Rhodocytophaga aerolata TaxID=455078 RepID=A0ABT8R8E7_9BACT|nr:hypothetical protein [Rhodocytophaga aerolata]MDO1447012.1 hypothetical protein [Rhodocytophaga aerolata]